MRRTFWIALAVTLLLTAAGEAQAQSGPAPGYDDPYAYAADHVVNETGEASDDPAGYAAEKSSVGGVENETEHAAWLACWTADHEAGSDVGGACDAYYTPPEAAAPAQPDEPAQPGAADAVQDRVDDAEGTVGEVVDAAKDAANEPGSAPEQVRRVVTAVAGFVDRTVSGLLDVVEETVAFGLETLGVGGTLLGQGVQSVGDGAVGLAVGVADGALDAVAQAFEDAAHGVDLVSSGATGAVDGAVGTTESVADAAQGAADDVGQAVSDAIDQITQWISGEPASERARDVAEDALVETLDGVDLPDLGRTIDDAL